MQVVALRDGFFQGSRRRTGAIFDMSEASMKKVDGKPVLPKWVKVVTDVRAAKAETEKVKQAEAEKQRAGALAASGGKAAKAKVDAAQELAG